MKDEDKTYIDRQSKLFDDCKEDLIEKYNDLYVLFEDGQVLDFGENRAEVAIRAYKKGGMRPLFIEKVTRKPQPIPTVWTPFLSPD
jgi:hypothetical protein